MAAIWLPPVLVATDIGPKPSRGPYLDAAELEQAIATRRLHVLFAAGGLVAIITLIFTWRRDRVAQSSADLDRDANATSRYTDAIKQLGDESLAIRLGGVYALERIAMDSLRDRQTILDVLAAYLRTRDFERIVLPAGRGESREPDATADPQAQRLPIDRDAAAAVLGRITKMSPPAQRVNLSTADLIHADLRGATLKDAMLWQAELFRANLSGADLSGAELTRSDLFGADLRSANLRGAHLYGAVLARADLRGADLRDTESLSGAILIDAWVDETTKWPEGFQPIDPAASSIGRSRL